MSTKKNQLSEEDRALFRKAVSGVTKSGDKSHETAAKTSKPRLRKTPKQSPEENQASSLFPWEITEEVTGG